MKMPQTEFLQILMKLGCLVEIAFIKMNLNLHLQSLNRTLLFCDLLENGESGLVNGLVTV